MIPLPLYREIQLAIEGMEGWCSLDKAVDLADWVFRAKPAIAVELGVFGGKSLVPIALALRHIGDRLYGKDGVVYGVDPWHVGPALEGDNGKENDDWWRNKVNLHDIHRLCMESLWKQNLDTHAVILRTTGEMAAPMFRDGSVGFLHQDSNHSELVSCRQVKLWAPKLTQKAHWILDDADWPSQAAAIRLIEELGFERIGGTDKYFVFRRPTNGLLTS